MKTYVSGVIGVMATCGAAQVLAQQPNLDEMVKWTSAEVVRYDVVAEYDGEAEILRPDNGAVLRTQVKDRVEVGFDWNQNEMKVVGTPAIKNFPSTTTPPAAEQDCPPARIDGRYEHVEATAVTGIEYNPVLQLTGTRSLPAGAIPFWEEDTQPQRCGNAWHEAAASTEPTTVGILVLPSMYLGMPAAAGEGVKIDAARSTITTVGQGWTYTYKLSIK